LRARVAESDSLSSAKKVLVDRQSDMVARDAASTYMLKPTIHQYSAVLHNVDAENAKLNQKIAQLDALGKGIYVGDDLIAIGSLVQKRRDIDLDEKRMEIEEKELSAVLEDHQRLIDAEQKRLDTLAEANVRVTTAGTSGARYRLGAEPVSRNAMEGATASMKASTASTPLPLHHRYMVAFPTPARAATPSIDIWWKPTVFRSSYVASRIALRDTSLRLRPCAAVVDGAAANGDTPGHFETSRFTTRGIFRKLCGVARPRFVVVFFPSPEHAR
jgi:hypothetical protein